MSRRIILKQSMLPLALQLTPGHVKRAAIHKRADLHKQAFGGFGGAGIGSNRNMMVTNSGAGWGAGASSVSKPTPRTKNYDPDADFHLWGDPFYWPTPGNWDKISLNPMNSAPIRSLWGHDDIHEKADIANNQRLANAIAKWQGDGPHRSIRTDSEGNIMYYPGSADWEGGAVPMYEQPYTPEQGRMHDMFGEMRANPELRAKLRAWAEENADELGIDPKWLENKDWVPDIKDMSMWREVEDAYDLAREHSDDFFNYTNKKVPGKDGKMVDVSRNIGFLRRGYNQAENTLGGVGMNSAAATRDLIDSFSEASEEPVFVVDAAGNLTFQSPKMLREMATGNAVSWGSDFLTGAGLGVGGGLTKGPVAGLKRILPARVANIGAKSLTVPGAQATKRLVSGTGDIYKRVAGAGINKLPTAMGNVARPVFIPGSAKTGAGNVLGSLGRYSGAFTGLSVTDSLAGHGQLGEMQGYSRDRTVNQPAMTQVSSPVGTVQHDTKALLDPDSDYRYLTPSDAAYELSSDAGLNYDPGQAIELGKLHDRGIGPGGFLGPEILAMNRDSDYNRVDEDLLAKIRPTETPTIQAPSPSAPAPSAPAPSAPAPSAPAPSAAPTATTPATPSAPAGTGNKWLAPALLGGGTLLGLAGLSGAFSDKKKPKKRKKNRRRR